MNMCSAAPKKNRIKIYAIDALRRISAQKAGGLQRDIPENLAS